MTMLMKYDVFSEDVSRFYIAECILAIEAVHKLGYIHRWVKRNMLIISRNPDFNLQRYQTRQYTDR